MKLIKPSYEILNESDLLRVTKEIELAARTCYKSEDKISENSDKELVRRLVSLGHEAMLEFGPSIVIKLICDRGVSHEIVRHRLCDFAQESTRYCNYFKDKFNNQITFIIPEWCKRIPEWEGTNLSELHKLMPDVEGIDYEFNWCINRLKDEEEYNDLIENAKWLPQQARSVLPNSLKTEIVVKANIREWRHIFLQRTSPKAHPQMRELMIPLLQHFKTFCPIIFDDINPK